MKKVIFCILSLHLTLSLPAQNIDSLFSIWNNPEAEPIQRCEALEAVFEIDGFSLMTEHIDSMLSLAHQQLALASEVNDVYWIVQAKQTIGSLILLQGNEDEALGMMEEMYAMAEENKNEKAMVLVLESYAGYYSARNDHAKSYSYYSEAIDLAKKLNFKRKLAYLLNNLAWTVRVTGNSERAIPIYLESAHAYEELGDDRGVLGAYLSVCISFIAIEDYKSAKDVLYKSLEHVKTQADSIRYYGTIHERLAMTFEREGDLEKVVEHAQIALSFFEQYPNENMGKNALFELAEAYQKANDKENALLYLDKFLEYGPRTQNTYHNSIRAGNLFIKLNEPERAISICSDVQKSVSETNSFIHIEGSCRCLYNAYRMKGQKELALGYYECANQYRDSLDTQGKSKELLRLDFAREIMLDSIDQIERERAVEAAHQEEIRKKQQTRNIALSGGLIALLLAGGFYSRYRYVNRAKKIIEGQKQEVEQAKKVKEQFLANMSHELRTPMHAISGMSKILSRNEHLPSQKPYLNAIRTSAENLVVILNDVLDISKMEAGKLDIESIPMSPRAVIKNVVDLLRYKAEEKGITLTYSVDDEAPDLVMGDPTRLNQILTNLAGNGIKFTEKGKVHIDLDIEGETMRYRVSDTGIGIPEDKQAFIFNSFEQSDKSITRQFGGTGLGLSICKQLAEMQQGTISVESQPGVGSTFIVTLPLIPVTESAETAASLQEHFNEMTRALKGLRILIAEDNPFNQMIARDDLNYYIEDVFIDIVENGAEAVEKYRTGKFDIILMDAQMPVMDGMEASEIIRTLEKEQGVKNPIPIIAMTASLLKSEIESMTSAGMDNYIPKPYHADQLIGTIYHEMNK